MVVVLVVVLVLVTMAMTLNSRKRQLSIKCHRPHRYLHTRHHSLPFGHCRLNNIRNCHNHPFHHPHLTILISMLSLLNLRYWLPVCVNWTLSNKCKKANSFETFWLNRNAKERTARVEWMTFRKSERRRTKWSWPSCMPCKHNCASRIRICYFRRIRTQAAAVWLLRH